MKRELLPNISILGTDFIVDVIKNELRENANEGNVMNITQMSINGSGKGYSFNYDLNSKNFPIGDRIFELGFVDDIKEVNIPDLVSIDPLRMAEKYNLSVEEVKGKTDYELQIVPGSLLDLRWNKGILPTIDIAGHTFYIDLQMDKLRPKNDFKSKGINLTEIKDYYDRDRQAYVIPYNPTTREFQQDDVFAMTELPKDTIIVQFPHQYELDKVGWNKKHNIQSSKQEITQMHFEARTLPWEDTNVIENIKRNVAEQLQPKEEYTVNEPKDRLYRIPIDTERELPTYQIHGTEFIVDVNQLELREKANPKNVISISDMDERSIEGYKFWYSPISHSLTTFSGQGAKSVEIPDFIELDPIGMAKKYNIPEDKIAGMRDFNLMVNQQVFDKITYQRIKPTIDIAGHPFYIDLDKDRLRPKDDIWSRGIIFSELEYYYSHKEKAYIIPYNKKTHTFQEISLNAKEIPENLIVVKIPNKRTLDPIGHNKSGNINSSDFLKKEGVHLHYEAKVIPWHQTRFAETVKRNNEKELKIEQKPNIKPKAEENNMVSKRKGRKI